MVMSDDSSQPMDFRLNILKQNVGGCFLLLTMYLRPYCTKSLKEDQNTRDAAAGCTHVNCQHSQLQYYMPKAYKNRFLALSLKRAATPAILVAGGGCRNRQGHVGRARFCIAFKMSLAATYEHMWRGQFRDGLPQLGTLLVS